MTEIDTAMTARFLAALSGDTRHTFQTFDDAKRGRRGMTRVLHGPITRHADTLATLNAKGAGVFFMVNRGDGMGRKADNVTACRALFVDLDGAPLQPVLSAAIAPRIVVESSPGKWHAYWPVVDLPPERFSSAQKSMAALFGGDPKVHDKPRVMRLPGFLHRKAAPFLSRLVECQPGALTWTEMAEAFHLADRLTLPDSIAEGERNDKLFKLARSAARKGVPEALQLAKALTVNARTCHPPLSDGEVRSIVASAYRTSDNGALPVPVALLESPAFKALDDSGRMLLVLAYRRADGFNGGNVTLPWSELADWFPREKTFHAIRARVVESGLLPIAQPGAKAMPRKGKGPTPNTYRLAIPPVSAPYSTTPIPPVSAPPEAFQALAVGAFEGALDAGGPKAARRA